MSGRKVICPECGGKKKVECDYCDGKGGHWTISGGEEVWEKCNICWGSGMKTCLNCNGWGEITVFD